ncbi:DNA-binding response regulator CreB [Shigella sonnei]|nr:DNA-binding response regulator CreB [Shigella sonnei]SIY97797.1 DNA-binding response regulator CreB [Shigella sonnei]SJJ69516.1 DNA-binding response regulator CreB [Shigella sonnei]
MQRETVWLVEDEQGIADTLVYMLHKARKIIQDRYGILSR